MIWLPRWVMQAKPCTRLIATDTPTAASSPRYTDPGHGCDRPGRERAPEELPFERDVDDPGALREEPGEGAEDEWGREPQGRVQGQQDLERELAHAGASRGRRCAATVAMRRASGGFSM